VASVENDARTLRYIRATRVFSVNMLHTDGVAIARKVVMPAEGRKVKGRSEEAAAVVHNKLDGLRYELSSEGGVPILLDALGWYTCSVQDFVPVGDHTLVIGQVTAGGMLRSGEMLIERDLGWEYAG
jgi:flavin reductase (DIM6/NTAB) family NADH-FMN oxidoreductase RutF